MAFSDLWLKLKEIVRRMFGMETTIEQTLNMAPAISQRMTEAIDRWTEMYEGRAPWLHEEPDIKNPVKVVSLGLPAFIASEKARMAVIELKSEITAPKNVEEKPNPKYFVPYVNPQTGQFMSSGEPKTIVEETATSPTERADFMNEEYQKKLLPKLRTQLEYGIAKGSLIIKPYVIKSRAQEVAGASTNDVKIADKYEFAFDFVQADCFYPFAFDNSGNLSEVAFVQTKTDKNKIYTRLEYHKLVGNSVQITNTAWENSNTTASVVGSSAITLGKQIPLTSVYEWKDIPERATIQNVDRLLFGYFKMPDANTIDPHSPLGMSGFARAEKLIQEADLQYSRLLWEYEAGEIAIDIDRDALKFSQESNGEYHYVNQILQNRLYRTVDLGESDTYRAFTPQLRDASIINGLNTTLMRIEDIVALSRGTMADVTAEARTATEIKILKQRSFSSNAEIQKALESALKDVIYAMDVLCTVYNIVGDIKKRDGKIDTKKIGRYDVSFTWDDSILVDVSTELQEKMALKQAGILSDLELRMWYCGEDKRQAQDALNRIAEENRQAMEQNNMMSSQMGQMIQQSKGEGNQSTPNNAQEKEEKQQQPIPPQEQQQEQKESE